ncbi:MAG: putative membrane-bound dehydrogenase-like protein [Pseudoalteromonas tetraodonis]|jgi:putative membrane-bound dehydrogenase-like protein
MTFPKKSALLVILITLCAIATHTEAATKLTAKLDQAAGTITLHREGVAAPILTQHARPDFRPYLHPILAPDGNGQLTEVSPEGRDNQTGLFWGFRRANGRDYFHHAEGTHWQRVEFGITEENAEHVKWRTVYEILDEDAESILTETQVWTMWLDHSGQVVLDLKWRGIARGMDVTISEDKYGGLFLRMPWEEDRHAHVFNAARNRDQKANRKRAMWLDISMGIEGRDDEAHIAIFDHPRNDGFPNAWRVDAQFGVGPSRAIQGDWVIKKGKEKIFQHRLVIYTGELRDKDLTEQWSAWSGQKYTSALWGIAQQEGHDAKFLSPDEAVDAMTLQKGFEVNAFAHEPMITQPMAFCWDDRGRLWIAENRDYESRGHGFSNSGDSRILILEDKDHDGVADSRKVFLEGVPFPAAIAVGMGGLWLGAPPNLLFVPDKDGDDKADVDDIEVRLTGWGIRDRHETLNSFHWGPDGWLYGCQGYATPSKVGKPKGAGKLYQHKEPFPKNIEFDGPAVDINGGVWRYHPIKDRFEVVAHGFSNPWGIDYDAKGQIFITACVIPHLWHVIPGGIYHRQGGSHFNPHVYSDIRTIADHRHRSAHGGARIYNSDAFPDRYQGQLFMANIHEHSVLVDKLEPSGSGFIGRHGENFLDANNAQWIGFSMEIGPDGNVYVLDWHDADICGKTVVNKETGRVFRIAPKESAAKDWEGRYSDVNAFDDARLVELQKSDSAWHARRARIVLQGRAAAGGVGEGTPAALLAMLSEEKDPDLRLRALWCLHVIGHADPDLLLELLGDLDAHLRAWAIQLLCEDKSPPAAAIDRFVSLAQVDPSAVVRLHLASALQRLEIDQRWSILAGLVAHAEDADDHNLPKMLWFALEPMVSKEPRRALELVALGKMPLLQNYTARRAAQASKANGLDAIVKVLGHTLDAETKKNFLTGTLNGLGGGGKKVPAPDNWGAVYARLKTESAVADLAQKLAQRFGDNAATAGMLAAVSNQSLDLKKRREAIRGLAAQRNSALEPKLIGLLDEAELRPETIRAIAAFESEALADELLKRYAKLSAEEKRATVETLASRPKSGWKLAQAIKAEKIPRSDIPAYVPRQLRRVVGSGFVEIWGPIDELPAAKVASLKKYRELLTEGAISKADPRHGKLVFANSCLSCHKMYGEGGEIGPDLTGANRGDLNYVLDNLLDPSAEIPEGYQLNVITTRDGRNYGGTVDSETDAQLVLRQAAGDPVTIEKSDIQSREKLKVSMMPEGLLATLKDEDVIALVRYLRTTKAVGE